MMQQQTLDKLHTLRWFGFAEAWRKQIENAEMAALSFDERLGLLVDQPGVDVGNLFSLRKRKHACL